MHERDERGPSRPLLAVLLLDTRTGFISPTCEATKRADTLATSWNTADSADQVRRDNEREAFGLLVGQMEKAWPRLVEQYARAR